VPRAVYGVTAPTPPPRAPYATPEGAARPPLAVVPSAAPTGVPEGVLHAREKLEKLLADAERLMVAKEDFNFEVMWLADWAHGREAMSGVAAAARWVLGLTRVSPIRSQPLTDPLPAGDDVSLESRLAMESFDREVWIELPRWYAQGVRQALQWATHDSANYPCPIRDL
jgi:hypothetical protein